jgi:hypothetical protein
VDNPPLWLLTALVKAMLLAEAAGSHDAISGAAGFWSHWEIPTDKGNQPSKGA